MVKKLYSIRILPSTLSCLALCFALISCQNDNNPDLVTVSIAVNKSIDTSVKLDSKIPDTCAFKPSIKMTSFKGDGLLYKERQFYDSLRPDRILTSYLLFKTSGSCNDEGVEIGNHKWIKDTLTIYTYWCHAGDPTGHEWGGRIKIFKWDCNYRKLIGIDSLLYLEIQGEMGGFPVGPSNKPEDMEMIIEREKFKKEMEKQFGGHFVIGKKADSLVKTVQKFLKKDINKATKSWDGIYSEWSK